MFASLELVQSYDCPSASEVILKNMGNTDQYQTVTKQSIIHVHTSWKVLPMYHKIYNEECG